MKRRATDGAPENDSNKRLYSGLTGFTNSWSLRGTEASSVPAGVPAGASQVRDVLAPGTTTSTNKSSSSSTKTATSAPKTLKACQNCRKVKIKCLGKYGEKCKRCNEHNLECVYEIKVATNATALPDAEWMSTVEKRLDGFGNALNMIVGLLQQNGAPQGHGSPGPGGVTSLRHSPTSLEYQSPVGVTTGGAHHGEMGLHGYIPHEAARVPDVQTSQTSQTSQHNDSGAIPNNNNSNPRIPSLLSLAGTPPTGQASPLGDFGPGSMDGFSKFLTQNTDMDFQQMLDDLDKFDRQQLDNRSSTPGGQNSIPVHEGEQNTNGGKEQSSASSRNSSKGSDDVSPESSLLNIFNSSSPLKRSSNSSQAITMKSHTAGSDVEFLRNKVISFEQASELFSFFHEKISPHLFGFSTSHLDLPHVWSRSPILVAAVCTVAAVHHKTLNYLFQPLKDELDTLAKQVLYWNITTEAEAIDTIVALCVAGFWLPGSSMLTAMALRLARNFSLNLPKHNVDGAKIEDRLRLWYLIYILDGHQSLAYNQTPLIEFNDSAVNVSRTLLLKKNGGSDKPAEILQTITNKSSSPQTNNGDVGKFQPPFDKSTLLSDITLISQVEFNQAIKCVFQERAWDLISPSSLGIPWKTNMELDKWMVAWACLLTPSETNQNPWSSKSTLIHYNFAKMHINSRKIRELQSDRKEDGGGGSPDGNHLSGSPADRRMSVTDEKSEAMNKNCDSIALSAAQSVIRLSTTDSDVLNALQYVPIHMHIMLYYAGILVLNSVSPYASPRSVRDAFELVNQLRSALFSASPRKDGVIREIDNKLKEEISLKSSEVADILALKNEDTEVSRESKRHIAAWPGSMSGHLDT